MALADDETDMSMENRSDFARLADPEALDVRDDSSARNCDSAAEAVEVADNSL